MTDFTVLVGLSSGITGTALGVLIGILCAAAHQRRIDREINRFEYGYERVRSGGQQ